MGSNSYLPSILLVWWCMKHEISMNDDFPIQEIELLTTKSKLADVINCSTRSIFNYHEIASIYVDDFLNDYLKLSQKIVTSYPLSIYQCWVLFRIHQFLKIVPKAELLKNSLEHDVKVQNQYSKAHFESIYPEVTQEKDTDGTNPILRIS